MQKITIQIGPGITAEISGEDEKDIWPKMAFWFSLPKVCPLCKNDQLVFDFATPKTFKYYKIRCSGPTPHSCNMGVKQIGEALYYDSRKWEVDQRSNPADDDRDQQQPAATTGPADKPGEAPNRGRMMNEILKLANDCMKAGIFPADVSKLSDRTDKELHALRNDLIQRMKEPKNESTN